MRRNISCSLCVLLMSGIMADSRYADAQSSTTLEVQFVYKSGEKVDARQMGSWVELEHLSTRKWRTERLLIDGLLSLRDLDPGTYKLWVRRHRGFYMCGVRRHSWKLRVKPGRENVYTLTVHLINNMPCAVQ